MPDAQGSQSCGRVNLGTRVENRKTAWRVQRKTTIFGTLQRPRSAMRVHAIDSSLNVDWELQIDVGCIELRPGMAEFDFEEVLRFPL